MARYNLKALQENIVTEKTDTVQKHDELEDEGYKEDVKMTEQDLLARLGEITHQTLCKSGARSYGDGTAYLSKTKQNEERKRLLIKSKKEKMKQEYNNMSEEV